MEEAFWAARQGDALLHTSFMADVLGAVLEVAANVVIDALIVGTTSLLATSVGITMGCTAVVLTGFVAGVSRSGLAAKGVTINNLLPGAFDTDRLRVTMAGAVQKTGQSLEDVRAARQKTIPAGRFGTPEEFGAICAFLSSVHAGYMTGQNVLVDGGAYSGTF